MVHGLPRRLRLLAMTRGDTRDSIGRASAVRPPTPEPNPLRAFVPSCDTLSPDTPSQCKSCDGGEAAINGLSHRPFPHRHPGLRAGVQLLSARIGRTAGPRIKSGATVWCDYASALVIANAVKQSMGRGCRPSHRLRWRRGSGHGLPRLYAPRNDEGGRRWVGEWLGPMPRSVAAGGFPAITVTPAPEPGSSFCQHRAPTSA